MTIDEVKTADDDDDDEDDMKICPDAREDHPPFEVRLVFLSGASVLARLNVTADVQAFSGPFPAAEVDRHFLQAPSSIPSPPPARRVCRGDAANSDRNTKSSATETARAAIEVTFVDDEGARRGAQAKLKSADEVDACEELAKGAGDAALKTARRVV